MKNKPEISVIIPVYNREGMIGDAINSVLAQTYSDYEILIIDDGSKDRTKEVVLNFKNPKIELIETDHQGPYIARNSGIKKSRGKYIAFLDSDDIWFPDKLEKQLRLINKNPNFALIFTNGFVVESDEADFRMKLTHYSDQSNKLDKSYKELLKENFISTSSVFVRKDVFDNLGYFLEENRGCLDYQMWLRIASQFKIGYINEPLVLFNAHESRLSAKKIDRLKDILYLYDLEESKLSESGSKSDLNILHDSKSKTLKELGVRLFFAKDNKKARLYFLKAINEGNQNLRDTLKFLFWFFIPYTLFKQLEKNMLISFLEKF